MAERDAAIRLDGMTQRFEWPLIAWGLALNLVWEFAHSALYTNHDEGLQYIVWTRIHCSVGDVLILLSAFWATAAVHRNWRWPERRSNAAASLFVGLGFAYTVWSEFFNTSIRGAWAYGPAMPRIFGLGLSPLLQWLVLPTLLVFIMRSWSSRTKSKGSQT